MSRKKVLFCCSLIFCMLLFGGALKAQDDQLFLGYWSVGLEESIAVMLETTKNRYDSLPSDIKSRAMASMTGRAFTFMGDSVYVDWNSRGQNKRTKGTWSFSSEESELLITVGNDRQHFAVSFQENGDLVIENKKPMGFFYRMYLRKEQ